MRNLGQRVRRMRANYGTHSIESILKSTKSNRFKPYRDSQIFAAENQCDGRMVKFAGDLAKLAWTGSRRTSIDISTLVPP